MRCVAHSNRETLDEQGGPMSKQRSPVWRCAPLLLALITISAALALSVARVHANGTPITIVLSYLDGVSTWGPTGATGVAELVTKESEIRVTATGLPRLVGEEYQVWIVNTATAQRMSLGAFNAVEDGRARLDMVVNREIPDLGWNLLLLSVEPESSTPQEPGSRRSIAGRFPDLTSAQGRPGVLPRTGGPAPESNPALPNVTLSVGVFTVLGLTAGAAVWLARRPSGRGKR
jgi:hypothetical protein